MKIFWIFLLIILTFTIILYCLPISGIHLYNSYGSIDSWIQMYGGIFGNIIGGAIGGYVAFLIAKMQIDHQKKQDTQDKTNQKINHIRLLIGELEHNSRVLQESIDKNNKRCFSRLQGGIWKSLNISVDWMDTKIFEQLFDVYMNIWSIKSSGDNGKFLENEIDRCNDCLNELCDLVTKLRNNLVGFESRVQR
ncbi:hypothetical protein [Paenibacillus elgii]|uniref:hypothetical protein n=1 Tax=Paenibacillus elgii TaxID=189691 RepID=UPI00203EDF00|nr:hypothetical protein [Paenibacillus elgii]MCM3270609.1 hypothetical protein [Paenibacillus elgii]